MPWRSKKRPTRWWQKTAFNRLFRYISGGNRSREKIAMTAPVSQGAQSEKGYLSHKSKLESWMRAKGLASAGEPQWARYNSPFTLWFLRRNEILVPVAPGAE